MGYWDLPEGTDCVGKTWTTTKVGTALGLVGSAYHIAAFQPDSALAVLQRATSTTVTMATMGAIFGMATCLSSQARESPDDPLNYFIGGCASGIFLGARSKYLFWHGLFWHVHGIFSSMVKIIYIKKKNLKPRWNICNSRYDNNNILLIQ
uniref:NADH dehydrogenase [ubiquinone] 1 alpha subcomplex subunit 11 n=1 Tax=Anabas testudineus TaxID=64144 RepID=A0AAQ6IHM4_ANATE